MAQYQLNYSGSEINQLLAKISVLESKLNTLQTTVNNIDTSSIQSELNSVKQQVQSINNELDTKDTTISNIQAKLTELENSINSLSSSIDSKDARVLADSKAYTDEQILKVSAGGSIDLDGYAKKTDLPTKTSQLTNDSGYLTEHQDVSGKANKSYVDTELAKKSDKTHAHSYNDLSDKPVIPSVDGLATKKELTDGLATKSNTNHTHDQYLTEHQDLSDYALKTEIPSVPTKTSQLTNDSGYLTSVPSEYITESELNTELSTKANKSDIPSLEGYATETYVQNKIAEAQLSGGEVAANEVEPLDDDIPKVFFNGDKPTSKTSVYATIEYISKTKHFKGYVDIKCQGTSSMSYPKKNYTIKIFTDETMETKLKQDFKGWGKQSKFCLKANYIDHSHARNICSAKLWNEIVGSRSNYEALPELLRTSPKNGAIDGFPIKVYYNNSYEGLYTWNIPKDKWMFNMDDSLDNHCVLCGEEYVSGCFRVANASVWSDEIHDVMPESIKTSFNNFITFVINSPDDEFRANLENYVYVDSLIDYYIFQYVICGLDSMGKNQLFATYDGTKWIATSYDMDSTFGLYWNGGSFVSAQYRMQADYESGKNTSSNYNGEGNLLYVRLEQIFPNEIRARYDELRNTVLSYTNVVNTFERFMDIPSKDLYEEDGTIYTGIPSQATNNIQQIRNYYRDRLTYVDGKIAGLRVPVPCTAISLDINTLSLTNDNKTATLVATVTPSDTTDTVVWSVAPKGICRVVNGKVTAVANGDCIITATCGQQSATCNVNVSGITITESGEINITGLDWSDTASYGYNAAGQLKDGDCYISRTPLYVSSGTYTLANKNDGTFSWKEIFAYDNGGNFVKMNETSDNGATGESVITITDDDNIAYLLFSAHPIAVTDTPVEKLAFIKQKVIYSEGSLVYSLDEERTLNGTSDYIDTEISLLDEDRDFTILMDFAMNVSSTSKQVLVHCMKEISPYPGINLQVANDRFELSGQSIVPGIASSNEGVILLPNTTTEKQSFAIRKTGNTIQLISKNGKGSATYNYYITDKNLLLGAYQAADGTKGRYANVTISRAEVWTKALTDEEIQSWINA